MASTGINTQKLSKIKPVLGLVEQGEVLGKIKVISKIVNPDICMSVQLSRDGKHYGVPLTNGNINVYNCSNQNLSYKLNDKHDNDQSRCATSIRFHPWGRGNLSPNNFLTATFTDGSIKTFDFSTLSCIHELNERRAVLTCDYSSIGDTFATSGDDGVLKIYDDETRRVLVAYTPSFYEKGRFQRVYSINYHPENTTELITGGWDDTIRSYDLRIPFLLNKFHGPHICGEGISFSPSGREFCTASWRKGDSLQIWDYGSSKLIKTLDCEPTPSLATGSQVYSKSRREPKPKIKIPSQMNYACKYYGANQIIVGGTLDNAVSLACTLTGEVTACVKGLPRSVYGVDAHGTKIAFVTGNEVALIDTNPHQKRGQSSSIY